MVDMMVEARGGFERAMRVAAYATIFPEEIWGTFTTEK